MKQLKLIFFSVVRKKLLFWYYFAKNLLRTCTKRNIDNAVYMKQKFCLSHCNSLGLSALHCFSTHRHSKLYWKIRGSPMRTRFQYLSDQTYVPLPTYSVGGQRQLGTHQIEEKRGTKVLKHMAKYIRQAHSAILSNSIGFPSQNI